MPSPIPKNKSSGDQAKGSPMSCDSESSDDSSLSILLDECIADTEELNRTQGVDMSHFSEDSDLSDLYAERQQN